MISIVKPLAALGLAGALALPAVNSSQADPVDAAAAGFAAGAAIAGAAAIGAATNPYYYEQGYAYDPYYGSGYAYAPGYADPGTVYVDPGSAYAAAPGVYRARRYSPAEHGSDTNYIGPWTERQLEGRDY